MLRATCPADDNLIITEDYQTNDAPRCVSLSVVAGEDGPVEVLVVIRGVLKSTVKSMSERFSMVHSCPVTII